MAIRPYDAQYWPGTLKKTRPFTCLVESVNAGLDPNTLWTEDDFQFVSRPSGGCIVRPAPRETETWPHWNTPVHFALVTGDLLSVGNLLECGADVNVYNSAGRTPLHEALSYGRLNIAKYLVERGADVNQPTLEARIPSVHDNRLIKGEGSELPLCFALRKSAIKMLQVLVLAGASLCPGSIGRWNLADLALLAQDRSALRLFLTEGIWFSSANTNASIDGTSIPDDVTADAKELLAFAKSNVLVPPADLYGVFRHVMSHVNLPRLVEYNDDTVNSIIQDVFQALYHTADIKRTNKNSSFCSQCRKFEESLLYLHEDEKEIFSYRMKLHQNRRDLLDSAQHGCQLCNIVAAAIVHSENTPLRTVKRDGTPLYTCSEPDSESVYLCSPPQEIRRSGDSRGFPFGGISVEYENFGQDMRVAFISEGDLSEFMTLPDDPPSTASPRAIGTAKYWLHDCRTNSKHKMCQKFLEKARDNKYRGPRRLIYIGKRLDDPRLVPGMSIRSPYCALSYCRDVSQDTLITPSNLLSYEAGFPLDTLPATFRNAIIAARQLDFDYIWIDALCIMKDEEEWTKEVSKMHEIYSDADLTISSLASDDREGDLFQPRAQGSPYPVSIQMWLPKHKRSPWRQGQPQSLAIFRDWEENKVLHKRSPAHSRGWTFQERLLSTRILFLDNGLLHWECLHHYTTEINPTRCPPWHSPHEKIYEKSSTAKYIVKGLNVQKKRNKYEALNPGQEWDTWQSLAIEYSRMNLIKSSDRLPAFLGIAKSMEPVLESEYIAGLWKCDRFLESVCWMIRRPRPPGFLGIHKTPKNHPTACNIKIPHEVCLDPKHNQTVGEREITWTWATSRGELSFECVSRDGRTGAPTPRALVVSIDVQTDESQSRVSGSIKLKGTLHHKDDFDSLPALPSRGNGYVLSFDTELGGEVAKCHALELLHYEKGPRPPPMRHLGHRPYPNGRPASTVFLLLQSVDDECNVFRRVGIVMVHDSNDGSIFPIIPKSPVSKLENKRNLPLTLQSFLKDTKTEYHKEVIII